VLLEAVVEAVRDTGPDAADPVSGVREPSDGSLQLVVRRRRVTVRVAADRARRGEMGGMPFLADEAGTQAD
jgi:hypothetical protein